MGTRYGDLTPLAIIHHPQAFKKHPSVTDHMWLRDSEALCHLQQKLLVQAKGWTLHKERVLN